MLWPTPVADLAQGFRYRWTPDEPHSNVEPATGGRPAAFLYLGENPEADTLANVYARINRARRIHALTASLNAGIDPRDAGTLAQDRLCVVYKHNHALHLYRPPAYASISDPAGPHVDDISAEE